jgi:hypothetical protein
MNPTIAFLILVTTIFISCKENDDNTPIKINLGSDTTIVFGDTLILDAGFGFYSYSWNNGLSDEQKLKVTNEGNYWVVGTINNTIFSDAIQIDTIRSCYYYCDTTVAFFDKYNLKIPCSYSYEDFTGDDSRSVEIRSKKQDVVFGKERDMLTQDVILQNLPETYEIFNKRMFIINCDNQEIGVVFYKVYPDYYRDACGPFFVKENSVYKELMAVNFSIAKKYEVIEILRTLKKQ